MARASEFVCSPHRPQRRTSKRSYIAGPRPTRNDSSSRPVLGATSAAHWSGWRVASPTWVAILAMGTGCELAARSLHIVHARQRPQFGTSKLPRALDDPRKRSAETGGFSPEFHGHRSREVQLQPPHLGTWRVKGCHQPQLSMPLLSSGTTCMQHDIIQSITHRHACGC